LGSLNIFFLGKLLFQHPAKPAKRRGIEPIDLSGFVAEPVKSHIIKRINSSQTNL